MTIESAPPWVQTASGFAFDLLEPRVEDVHLEDIAAHLSKLNRYAGATMGPCGYSVAQHSVHVSRILETWGAPLVVGTALEAREMFMRRHEEIAAKILAESRA